jgi:hypothetical protein
MRVALAFLALLLAGCSRREPMQLWYWHHSYLVSTDALARSKALVDRAAAAGYTGLALWDSSLFFLSRSDWPEANTGYLREFAQYARAKGLAVMPAILPYGHSDDVLKENPNWAEGQRVIGARFRRAGEFLEQVKEPIEPLGRGRFQVQPWRQYRVRFLDGGTGPVGAIDVDDRRAVRLDDVARPGLADFTFNSAGSARVHVFGPGRFTIEETALANLVRRAGAPLKLYDGATVYREGFDFEPVSSARLPVRVTAESEIRDGQQVSMDYYAVQPVYGEGVGMCLTDPDVERWAADNARRVASIFPPESPLFLQYDEMRHVNSCASCRAMGKTPGELLAWSVRRTIDSLPRRELYIWSDMFDPWHNAHDHFYFVEGNLEGSWKGLPRDAVVMNWNGAHLRASLEWFASLGNRQVIAGFYDSADHEGNRAARRELGMANGIRGIAGVMYTTWRDDYSQLESYARGARAQWPEYEAARPW